MNFPDTVFDILIKNGTIYDGTLAEPYVADIGIKGDKVAAIGNLTVKAEKTIQAKGHIVTPGFIDVHTHCDLYFKLAGQKKSFAYALTGWNGNYNYLYQGVTTVVTSNCGYGYTDIDYWFDIVNSVKFGTNVYHLIPHGAIREELFGENQPRQLNAEQLNALKKKVAEEMDKGAVGISTGLAYVPGCLSPTEELIELAKVVKKYEGIYTTHMRDESGKTYENGKTGVGEAIKETIEISRRAGIPVQISHLKLTVPYNEVKPSQMLELIEKARRKELNVTADQYPYDARATFITILIPTKYVTSTSIKKEFKTKEGRKEIKKAVERTFLYLSPEKILIISSPEKKLYEGKTLQEIAGIEGKEPSDGYVDMVCGDNEAPMGIFFDQDINVVRDIMPHDYIFTASDGWPLNDSIKSHPRLYGTFTKKIKKFVLEEKLMSLTAAIRSMTSLPAEKFHLKGRGKIAEGYFADIAVINLNTITDRATYLEPQRYSEGIVHLLVNGVFSMVEGKATGSRAGRALRRI